MAKKTSEKINNYLFGMDEEGEKFLNGVEKLFKNYQKEKKVALKTKSDNTDEFTENSFDFIEKMALIVKQTNFAKTAHEFNFYNLPEDKKQEVEQKCFEIINDLQDTVPMDIIEEHLSFFKECGKMVQKAQDREEAMSLEEEIRQLFHSQGEVIDNHIINKQQLTKKYRDKGRAY